MNSTEVFEEAFTTIQVSIGILNRKQNRSLGIEFWVAGINSNLEIVQRTHPGVLVGTRACEVPAIL